MMKNKEQINRKMKGEGLSGRQSIPMTLNSDERVALNKLEANNINRHNSNKQMGSMNVIKNASNSILEKDTSYSSINKL